MRITPLDVRKQEFRRGMRGLDADEVYAFLATIADEYEVALTDNKQLRERVLELDEKVGEYRNMEKTLRDTLLTAERVMTEARQNATKEADLILRDAKMTAEHETSTISSKVESLKAQLRELRGHRDAFLARLRGLNEAQLGLVDAYTKEFAEDDSAGPRIRTSEALPVAEIPQPAPAVVADVQQAVEHLNPVSEPTYAEQSEPSYAEQAESAYSAQPAPATPAELPEFTAPVAAAQSSVPDQWRDYAVGSATEEEESIQGTADMVSELGEQNPVEQQEAVSFAPPSGQGAAPVASSPAAEMPSSEYPIAEQTSAPAGSDTWESVSPEEAGEAVAVGAPGEDSEANRSWSVQRFTERMGGS